MKTKILILAILLFTVRFAMCGPFVSEILTPTSPPFAVTVAASETFQLYTFAHFGNGSKSILKTTIGSQTATVVWSSYSSDSERQVVVAGPATVTVSNPTLNATTFITYRIE